MGVGAHRGKWRYRFWFRGQLYERGGHETKWAARNAEAVKLKEIGALGVDRRQRHQGKRLADVLTEYLATRKGRPNYPNEDHALKLVSEQLGNKPIDQVTSRDVQAFQVWRRATVSAATANRTLAYLSHAYTWAAQQGHVPDGYNPARGTVVKRERETFRPWVILSREQEIKLLAAMPEHEQRKVVLLKNLGVRLGVVVGLEWDRVDWPNRLVTWESKGKTGIIPLNETAYKVLHKMWEESGEPAQGRVFAERSISTLRRHWNKARTAIGLPTLRRHDLRVTFARQLHARGASLKEIQGCLGHSSISMTTRYIPPDLEARRRAVRLLDEDA